MAKITIDSEERDDRRWTFAATIEESAATHRHRITLSWADYNLWCPGGEQTPEQVVRRALEFLLEREPASAILSKFDCSVIRRYFPEVDQVLPRKL